MGSAMILALMAFCVAVMWAFPETSMGRWLNTILVERPLAWLSRLKRRDLIFLLVMAALLLAAGDFIVVFGASELVAIGVNLSFYFDAVLVTSAAAIAAAAATACRRVRARLSIWRRAAAQRRAVRQSRPRRARRPKSRDDEDAAGWDCVFAV
jgi:hypothetical protein